MLFELWKQSSVARGKTNGRSGKRRKPPRVALALEWLETRELLSVATPNFIIASTQHATTTGASGVHPQSPPPSSPPGFSPSQIENAYGFNQISFASYTGSTLPLPGATQTIAIVDAYNDPNIYSDLETFDSAFGLPNPNLTVVNQSGQVISTNGHTSRGVTPPSNDSSWAVEESLDVEWAHAIAPGANIVLVEANDPSISNLMAAVTTAGTKMGASVVSMSWGGSEFSGETSYDSDFATPGVTFVASSGDNGSPPEWPAISPNVVCVGGTSLTLKSGGGYGSEAVWNNNTGSTGGGISSYESLPSYQVAAVTNNPNIPGGTPTTRTTPDVAFDSDPNTGVAVYDSFGGYGWVEVGGTSDAAPQWAALIAIANQGCTLDGQSSLTGPTQTLPMLYQMGTSTNSSTYFHDITRGSNGTYSAGTGYDLATGLGTPIANEVVNYLVHGPSSSGTPPPPTGLTAIAASSSQINLSWLDSGPANGFLVYRSTNATSGFSEIGTTAAGVTTYSDTGLTANTTYYYEVFAVNSVGDSGASNIASASTSTPPAPTGLTATTVSSNQINLSWNAASNATGGYLIDSSLTGAAGSFTQIASTTSTTISLVGLNPSTTYYYEVFAVNSLGDSPPSSVVSATTLGTSPGAPPAPTGLTATAASSSQIDLSWNAVSGATGGYLIDSSLTGVAGSFTQIASTTSTTISQIGLNPSTTYYYEVFAVNSAGDSPPSNIVFATTLGTSSGTPPAPTGLTATAASSSQINLSWNTDSGATGGFLVYRSTNATSGFSEIGTTAAGVTTYSDIGLTANTTYYYEVFAVNSVGDSGASNIASASTSTPPAPTGLTATAVSSSQIDLSWNAVSGATGGYLIDSSLTGAAGSFTQVASTTSTTISQIGLNPSTTYYYEVFAVNSAGDSPPSNIASATTQGTIVYVVTSTADDGSTGTLRDAINQVNAGKYKEIDFNIAGTGVQTINLTSALPAITAGGVFINGLSESQFQGVNSRSPRIELNGSGAGSSSDGLLVQGSSCIVSGLILSNFSKNGMEVAGSNSTIGGTTTAAGNVLSGNSNDGLLIDSGVSGVQVQGNYIGTNAAGITAVANSGNGIEIQGTGNTIGGSSGSRNLISGNSNDGVKIDSGGSGNLVEGNAIGVNIYDTAALGNSGNGIEVAGSSNTIGASYAVAPNEISGNSKDGVLLDSGSSGNQVLGNYIGTNHAGTAAMANKVGIEDAGSSNTLGGSVLGARNVISGNSGDGVLLDSTANAETMQGNYIGVNVGGNVILANGNNGVEVQGTGNTIGGNSAANYFTRNFISGNGKDGVLLDSGASGNQVLGNFIGIGVSGTNGVGNLANGIESAGSSNTIGGTVSGNKNILSGNGNDGVLLDSTATNNLLQGNDVGTDYTGKNPLGNSGNGIEVAGSNNMLGGTASGAGNIISANGKSGVLVSAGSGDTVSRNSIFANLGLGISLASGANNNIAAPTLNSATANGSTLTVQGSFTAATANVSYVLQFFANPSGDAEGRIYLGSLTVTPTSTGTQSFTFTATTTVTGTYPLITVTLTDGSGDTSPFSNGVITS